MTRGLAAGSVRGKVRSMSLTASSVPGTFLALLDDQERAALFELGTRREFARGAERVMVPEIGRVKMTRIEAGGHETRLSIRDPGDILGELSLIDEQPRWRLSLRSSRCESS
jgi:CRP-like cAMP-binding protein